MRGEHSVNVPQRMANAWRIRIRGHDKSAPTAADGLPKHCEQIAKMLRTDCQNAANGLLKQFKRITITMQTGCYNAADDYKKQKRHVAKSHVPPINY